MNNYSVDKIAGQVANFTFSILVVRRETHLEQQPFVKMNILPTLAHLPNNGDTLQCIVHCKQGKQNQEFDGIGLLWKRVLFSYLPASKELHLNHLKTIIIITVIIFVSS